MRTILSFLVLWGLCAGVLTAQSDTLKKEKEEIRTLFGPEISHGGYGAVTMGYTQMDGKDAWIVGGRAAWIIDHGFALGVGGYGLTNDIVLDDWYSADERMSLIVGYGGLLLEPIFFAREPVHFCVPVLVGAGGVSTAPRSYWTHDNVWDPEVYHNDVIFVFEPGIEIELNLTRFMRLSAGGSYRLTSPVDLPDMADDILNGPAATFSLKFGKF